MLSIFKWYSIIFMAIMMLTAICKMFYSDDGATRLGNFIALILHAPIIIYLILK